MMIRATQPLNKMTTHQLLKTIIRPLRWKAGVEMMKRSGKVTKQRKIRKDGEEKLIVKRLKQAEVQAKVKEKKEKKPRAKRMTVEQKLQAMMEEIASLPLKERMEALQKMKEKYNL